MGEAKRLSGMIESPDRFDIPHSELQAAQLAALNERFQEAKDRIKLVGLRAEEAGLTEVRGFEDIVQLLLPHTAYKSYPENWLLEGRWDRLTKWLGTVSPHPIRPIDLSGIDDIDDWLARLEGAGHFISCSSGTTGKSAMLIASQADMTRSASEIVNSFAWGSRVEPLRDRLLVSCVGVAQVPKNIVTRSSLRSAFGNEDWPHWDYPVPPITVGSLTRMIVLRKAIADGTAMPGDIAEFERTAIERQAATDAAVGLTADFLIANREKKLLLVGFWGGLHPIAKAVRERGYSAKDFHPDNAIYVGGGLKRAQLPADYEEFTYGTFNIAPRHYFQMYSMQEINTSMPKCQKGGRYHLPPWLVPLVLDQSGSTLVSPEMGGVVEGRAAFFDLSLDGRWGGVISGDRISVDFGTCACGQRGPSIRDDIARYADLGDDDKIGCAGTIDAYVRGIS